MPRRPRRQPRSFSDADANKKPPALTRKADAKMKKWIRREDIEGDEEDQFHDTRDRVLLEGENAEGDEEWGDGEEEVFGLGLENESEDDDADDDDDDDEGVADGNDEDEDEDNLSKLKKTKKSVKKPDPSPSPSDSDSEKSESWGRTKSAYYASNAGLLAGKEGEEDEEEANEMEEHEARRLQARMQDTMADEDFGLVDVVDLAADDAMIDDELSTELQDAARPSATVMPLDKATALRRLEKMSPETLALAREWNDVARDLVRVQQRLDKLESTTSDALSLGLSHLHHQTLLTYVTTLAFYLHLRTAPPATQLHTQTPSRFKPVLERLLTLKQALSTMEELDFDASDDEDSDSDISSLDDETKADIERIFGPSHARKGDMAEATGREKKKLGLGELDALLREADAAIEQGMVPKKQKKAKSRFDMATDTPALVKGVKKNSQKPTGRSKRNKPEATFDLVEPEFVPSKRTATRSEDNELDAYGEATVLSMVDDADKKARKRTLRFHTSKIETSARKREEGREKLGGDDDIPYRERKKEKEARVRREVEKTRGEGGDDLDPDGEDGADPKGTSTLGSGKRKRDGDDPSDEEGGDGYYDLVKRVKKERKEGEKRDYEEARLEERMDVVNDGVGGPRSLTRAILKNKGLTPRRAKSVRNPRVKKRERFEKAKKKVRSQKAVYKGGLSGRPYGGEESGITKVVKSVKL